MKNTIPIAISTLSIVLTALFFPAATARSQTQIPCIETNGVKFILPPNTQGGLDVKDSRQNTVLADDFFCNTTGPITDIHLWGSWLGDQHGVITNFWIGIYNDVPAVLGPGGQIIIPSHPGTSLLWQQSFSLLQYAESPYGGPGQEYFYNPTNNQIVGGDTQAWYYCFYPTNPFVQQGTANAPTNYWLAVRAQLDSQTTQLFGWKTSLVPYNDAAVWGTVDATGVPIGNWRPMTNPITQQKIDLSFKLTTPTNQVPPTGCIETNGIKYIQGPNLFGGYDVVNNPHVLADDFVCISSGPITDLHLWGSWLFDSPLTNSLTFWLGIFDDVPVGPENNFSHPGTNLLWQQWFTPGQYAETVWATGQESFLDPGFPQIVGSDSQVWYYCFYPTNPFAQTGSAAAPKTYWLAAYTQLPAGSTGHNYGWKTATNVLHDTSVHTQWPGTPPTNNPSWITTKLPTGGPLDLAFKLTTPTNTPPPVVCVETNGVKYVQTPNLDGGLDVWNSGPWMLADDFLCSNSGPISDIHVWGSWLNNQVGTNTLTFWLGIYDDVPLSANNTFSRPGDLLWQQWFAPGEYAENVYGSGAEQFLDPGPPVILGIDQQAWYYCFYPTNPLVQIGTAAAPKTYWLAVYAQPPAGANFQYGWKTTQFVRNDVSVHAPWPGIPPAGNPGWLPTIQPPNNTPLDLAFKITTPTNRCPVPILCTADKTVECGSTWSFDPPVVGADPCCSGNPVVTFSTVTNILGPCQRAITRTWYINDCVGFVGVCQQTVTVKDTTPPVFTLFPTNLIVSTCDSNIPVFWSVTATDECSAVTITSTPPSGSSFAALSTNIVAVTASDACGNATNKTFTVSVVRPVIDKLSIQYFYFTNNVASNLVVLTWTNGILQVSTNNTLVSTNVLGPYTDVPGATSPYTNTTAISIKFYRLRCN